VENEVATVKAVTVDVVDSVGAAAVEATIGVVLIVDTVAVLVDVTVGVVVLTGSKVATFVLDVTAGVVVLIDGAVVFGVTADVVVVFSEAIVAIVLEETTALTEVVAELIRAVFDAVKVTTMFFVVATVASVALENPPVVASVAFKMIGFELTTAIELGRATVVDVVIVVGLFDTEVVVVRGAEVGAGFVAAVGGCEIFLDDEFGTKKQLTDSYIVQ
jgi:hypothetical protein